MSGESHYWVYSHIIKIRDKSIPELYHYTLDELNEMTNHEQIEMFIKRNKKMDPDNTEFSEERMRYIIEHSIAYDRTEVGYQIPNTVRLLKVQYTKVLMPAARAVEFKMRFFTFDMDQ